MPEGLLSTGLPRLVYEWLRYILPLGLGSTVKAAEEDHYLLSDLVSQLITTEFVEQTLFLPESAKYI